MKIMALGLLLAFSAWARADTRVALVTPAGDAWSDQVASMAVALMDRDSGLIAVERREMDRILEEQRLSLAGWSSRGRR